MAKKPEDNLTKYTGLIILAWVAPVCLLFIYLDQREIGLDVSYCLAPILFAGKMRWDLRKHVWFWFVMAVVAVMHVPLVIFWPWPNREVPRIVILPYVVADCSAILGLLRVAERLTGAKEGEEDTLEDGGNGLK